MPSKKPRTPPEPANDLITTEARDPGAGRHRASEAMRSRRQCCFAGVRATLHPAIRGRGARVQGGNRTQRCYRNIAALLVRARGVVFRDGLVSYRSQAEANEGNCRAHYGSYDGPFKRMYCKSLPTFDSILPTKSPALILFSLSLTISPMTS